MRPLPADTHSSVTPVRRTQWAVLPALLLTVSTIFMAAPANALPTDRDQPLQVSADSATFDEKTGVAVYKGSVVIRQGSLEMRADEFVIKVNKKGAVESTTSRGNPARFQQTPDAQKSPVLAEADRIDYDLKNEIVTLTGKARLRQDGASFQGATISYNTARQQVEAKGDASNRVQLVLPPQPREARPAPAKDTRK